MATSEVLENANVPDRMRELARELGSKKLAKRADALEQKLTKTAAKIERELEKRAKKHPTAVKIERQLEKQAKKLPVDTPLDKRRRHRARRRVRRTGVLALMAGGAAYAFKRSSAQPTSYQSPSGV
jgi:hypothetical protein